MSNPDFWTLERRKMEHNLFGQLAKLDDELDTELLEGPFQGDIDIDDGEVTLTIYMSTDDAADLMEGWSHYQETGCDEPITTDIAPLLDFIAQLVVEELTIDEED